MSGMRTFGKVVRFMASLMAPGTNEPRDRLFILNYVHGSKNCKCPSALIKIYSFSVDVNRLAALAARPGADRAGAGWRARSASGRYSDA